MRDIGETVQEVAQAHLDRCDLALAAQEDETFGYGTPEWPTTAGPYCGCTTCIIRETLWISWPMIERYASTFRKSY